MSVRREVDDLVDDTAVENLVDEAGVSAEESMNTALGEVTTLLSATGDSLSSICGEIETATSREACQKALRKLNGIFRLVMVSATGEFSDSIIRKAIASLVPGPLLVSQLAGQDSVAEGIAAYKKLVVQNLARRIRLVKTSAAVSDDLDDDLFARFLPGLPQALPVPVVGAELGNSLVTEVASGDVAPKRTASQCSSIPALM